MTEKTSLFDFISKAESSVTEETASETSTDTETTDGEESVSTDSVESTDDSTESTATGDGSNEQVFEIKGTKVPLKDLLNAFETREEISKRFNEVGKKEAKLKADFERAKKEREELDFINEKFEEMQELVTQGNPMAALQIAVNMSSRDTSQPKALSELIQQAVTIAENFQNMSEEEQKIFLDKEELSVKERNLARKEKRQKELDDQTALKSFYDETLSANNVTDAEIEAAVEDINKLPQFRKLLEEKSDPKDRITYTTSWVLGQRLNNTVFEGIKKIDPKLAQDNNFRLALLDHVDPRCTIDDVAAIVREYKKPTSNDSANGSEASTKDVAPKKTTTPNRAPTEKKAENNKPVLTWAEMVAKHS